MHRLYIYKYTLDIYQAIFLPNPSRHLKYCFQLSSPQRRRQWHPTPVLLLGKSHGQRGLVGCSPWSHEELDTTERLHFHFSLSCIGEGNGNPLQCSCLEKPRDGEAWWASVYGVAQSQTWLKRLSSSSSNDVHTEGFSDVYNSLWNASKKKKMEGWEDTYVTNRIKYYYKI